MKARITVTFEYDIDAENYYGCTTPEEMLAVDMQNYGDPMCLAEAMEFNDETLKISGEVLS